MTMHEPNAHPESDHGQILSEADARAIDHLQELGEQPHDQPGRQVDAARLTQARALASLLSTWKVDAPPLDLKNRTLAAVKQAREQSRQRTEPFRLPFSPGRLTEVAAIAAMVLITFSLAVPMLVHARDNERKMLCQSNLRQAGGAMNLYAVDYRGVLPRHQAAPNAHWWRVGQSAGPGQEVTSNSANLYLLARAGYIHPASLACPDNAKAPRKMSPVAHDWDHADQVSYSYQTQFTPRPYRLDDLGQMAVLADRNPMFQVPAAAADDQAVALPQKLTYRHDLPPNTASPFHHSKGQNVLSSPGEVLWKTEPLTAGNDNIWLINQVHQYQGNEVPADHYDTFLTP